MDRLIQAAPALDPPDDGAPAHAAHVHYQAQEDSGDTGAVTAAVLPLLSLALLVPLGILALGILFPTITIVTPTEKSE